MNRKIKNIINITAFLVCIGLINIAGQNIEIEIRGMNAFTFILIVAVLLQIIFFIPSFLLKTEKYYDLVGSLTYIATVSLAYFSVENKTMIDSIIYFYVMIWASRLGIYLFTRVRNVGKELGLPDKLIKRHPFPGPGLGVRIIGEITKERVYILQEADKIYIDILEEEGLYDEIWQAFAVLIPVKTVGVMGDQRTYENLLGLRAVTSTDGMTADWYRMPPEVLSKISNHIVNSVKGVNRVTYDVTSKPPGTIEWE